MEFTNLHSHLLTNRLQLLECMKYEFFRLSSFASFPQKSGGRPLKLAKAGFLFTPLQPDDDTVTCFSCQTTKKNWVRFDDPMEIHKSLSPDCNFINGISENVEIFIPKDDVYQRIKTILKEISKNTSNLNTNPLTEHCMFMTGQDDIEPPRNPTIMNNEMMLRLMEENRALKEQRLCKICFVSDQNILLLPCCHIASCASCWRNLQDRCPWCRQNVAGIVKIFYK